MPSETFLVILCTWASLEKIKEEEEERNEKKKKKKSLTIREKDQSSIHVFTNTCPHIHIQSKDLHVRKVITYLTKLSLFSSQKSKVSK